MRDLRLALRLMARQKGFAAVVLATFAIGVGANMAIFAMAYGVLLRPLPYPTAVPRRSAKAASRDGGARVFAVVAMVLAAVGLYGVLSHHVMRRRREMGVRAALGARRGAIVSLVVREGLSVTAGGAVVGLAAAAALARLMAGLLFGVEPHDPIAFAAAPSVVILVALAATLIPACRAASTDAIETLRHE